MRAFVYQLESVVGMHFVQFQLSCGAWYRPQPLKFGVEFSSV